MKQMTNLQKSQKIKFNTFFHANTGSRTQLAWLTLHRCTAPRDTPLQVQKIMPWKLWLQFSKSHQALLGRSMWDVALKQSTGFNVLQDILQSEMQTSCHLKWLIKSCSHSNFAKLRVSKMYEACCHRAHSCKLTYWAVYSWPFWASIAIERNMLWLAFDFSFFFSSPDIDTGFCALIFYPIFCFQIGSAARHLYSFEYLLLWPWLTLQ